MSNAETNKVINWIDKWLSFSVAYTASCKTREFLNIFKKYGIETYKYRTWKV